MPWHDYLIDNKLTLLHCGIGINAAEAQRSSCWVIDQKVRGPSPNTTVPNCYYWALVYLYSSGNNKKTIIRAMCEHILFSVLDDHFKNL